MKRFFTILSSSCIAAACFAAPQSIALDFRKSLLENVTIRTYSDGSLNADFYTTKYELRNGWHRHIITDDAEMNTEGTYALLSPSRLSDNVCPDNWLITPEFEVTDNSILEWTAKSVHSFAKDNYDVMISTGGTEKEDFNLLTSILHEEYLLNRHIISLSEYEGKTVRIAFVHHDSEGYILAIDNIYAGIASRGYKAFNSGDRFFGRNDEQTLKYQITNFGGKENTELAKFIVVSSEDDSNVIAEAILPETFDIASDAEFEFPFELPVGTFVKTALYAVYADGSKDLLMNDFINVSEFRRNVYVEKFTATWCNNCPKVVLPAKRYLSYLGKNAIYVEPHVQNMAGSDKNQLATYINPVNYNVGGDYPALMINRTFKQDSWKPSNTDCYDKAIVMPCTVDIRLKVTGYDYQRIMATATFVSAEDIDNTSGNYKVGFTLAEKNVYLNEKDFQQTNSMSGSTLMMYGESNFLPSKHPREITHFSNVVRGPEDASTGIEGSLPSQIKAGEEYEVNFVYDVPANVVNNKDLMLVATANYHNSAETGLGKAPILNAASTDLEYTEPSGIDVIAPESIQENAIFTITGIRINGSLEELPEGLYIVNGKKIIK